MVSVGPDGGDLRFHVCRLQTAFSSVPLSKFEGLAPFRAAQTSLHRISDELFRCDLFAGFLGGLFEHRVLDDLLIDHLLQFQPVKLEDSDHLQEAGSENLFLREP